MELVSRRVVSGEVLAGTDNPGGSLAKGRGTLSCYRLIDSAM